MRAGFKVALTLALPGLGCVLPLGLPTEPLGVPFDPPAHYREVWDSAQVCTGRRGDFARVVWYEMPGNFFTDSEQGALAGEWFPRYSVTMARDWKTTDWVVKHEMIHVLLQRGHNQKTLARDWGEKCHAAWGYQPRDTTYRP